MKGLIVYDCTSKQPRSELVSSEDGNAAERKEFIKLMEQIVSGVDHLKDPNRAHLKGEKES
ncbi:hypothetical protein ACEQPO_05860 [Bacillus sp. SL00103]